MVFFFLGSRFSSFLTKKWSAAFIKWTLLNSFAGLFALEPSTSPCLPSRCRENSGYFIVNFPTKGAPRQWKQNGGGHGDLGKRQSWPCVTFNFGQTKLLKMEMSWWLLRLWGSIKTWLLLGGSCFHFFVKNAFVQLLKDVGDSSSHARGGSSNDRMQMHCKLEWFGVRILHCHSMRDQWDRLSWKKMVKMVG